MDHIELLLKSNGKLYLSILATSHARLTSEQVQKGWIIYDDVLQSLYHPGNALSAQSMNAHASLIVESCLMPVLTELGQIKLQMSKDLMGNETAFFQNVFDVLRSKAGSRSYPCLQDFYAEVTEYIRQKNRFAVSAYDMQDSRQLTSGVGYQSYNQYPSSNVGRVPHADPYLRKPNKGNLPPASLLIQDNDLPDDKMQQGNPNIEYEKSEPIVRLLAQVRKVGMDILFPQTTQDKILACIFVAIQSSSTPAHRELIDMVMAVKDANTVRTLEHVSKTKVRGVLALLKHGELLITHGAEGEPVRLYLAPGIDSFKDLRARHDLFLAKYMSEHHLFIPSILKSELIWQFEESTKERRLAAISTIVSNLKVFFAGYVSGEVSPPPQQSPPPHLDKSPQHSHQQTMNIGRNGYQSDVYQSSNGYDAVDNMQQRGQDSNWSRPSVDPRSSTFSEFIANSARSQVGPPPVGMAQRYNQGKPLTSSRSAPNVLGAPHLQIPMYTRQQQDPRSVASSDRYSRQSDSNGALTYGNSMHSNRSPYGQQQPSHLSPNSVGASKFYSKPPSPQGNIGDQYGYYQTRPPPVPNNGFPGQSRSSHLSQASFMAPPFEPRSHLSSGDSDDPLFAADPLRLSGQSYSSGPTPSHEYSSFDRLSNEFLSDEGPGRNSTGSPFNMWDSSGLQLPTSARTDGLNYYDSSSSSASSIAARDAERIRSFSEGANAHGKIGLPNSSNIMFYRGQQLSDHGHVGSQSDLLDSSHGLALGGGTPRNGLHSNSLHRREVSWGRDDHQFSGHGHSAGHDLQSVFEKLQIDHDGSAAAAMINSVALTED